MRVFLVNTRLSDSLPETNITGTFPSLGLGYLASMLRQAGHAVAYFDEQVSGTSAKTLCRAAHGFGADMVLLSSTTPLWPKTAAIAGLIKRVSSRIAVGVGGPHVSLYPLETVSCPDIDFAVFGEGEETILEIARALESGTGLHGIKGCVYRDGARPVSNPAREPIADLDSIPFPAADLLQPRKYVAFSVGYPFFPMVTSRGCPFSCSFCYQSHLGPFRSRSAENVVAEMDLLVRVHGVREIIMFDETFAVDEARVLRMAELMEKEKLRCGLDVRTRISLLNEGLLTALKRAGCRRLHLGIESGNDDVLARMNKGISVGEIREKIGLARKIGFELRGYFMLAFPGETPQTIQQTVELALSLPLDWASFSVTLALPGTTIYDEGLRTGYFPLDYWKEYACCRMPAQRPYFVPAGMQQKDLFRLKRNALAAFYLRPGILWGLAKLSRPRSLFGNLFTCARLLPAAAHSLLRA